MSRRVTAGLRWMAISDIAPRRGVGTELGLQAASLTFPSVAQSSSGRKMCGATQLLQIGVAEARSPRGMGTLRSG